MEKIKFHRHKCEDTQVVQDELNEIQLLKQDMKQQSDELNRERGQLRDRMKENIENNMKYLTDKQKENLNPTHSAIIEDMKEQAHHKEVINII